MQHEPPGARAPAHRIARIATTARLVEVVATAACTAALLAVPRDSPTALRASLLVLGAFGAVDVARREARAPGDPRPVMGAVTVLLMLAVLAPVRFGTDVPSYAMVGRTVAVHHASPYTHAPDDFPDDPFAHAIGRPWRGATTPYGLLFVVHAAVISAFAGTHPLVYRVAFQASAALAVGACLLLLWRDRRSAAPLALVGLHPVVVGAVVNAGHNDAIAALAILGAVLLLQRARWRAAGFALAAGLLVKLTVGLVVLPLLVWTAARAGRRATVEFIGPTVLFAVPLTLFVPNALTSIRRANEGVVTRLSPWNIPLRASWLPFEHVSGTMLGAVSLVFVGALVVLGALVATRQRDPATGATIGVGAWLVGAAYVLQWYAVLALPAAALRPASRLARFFAFQGGLITLAWAFRRSQVPNDALRWTFNYVGPLVVIAVFVWAVAPSVTQLRTRRTSPIATA